MLNINNNYYLYIKKLDKIIEFHTLKSTTANLASIDTNHLIRYSK